MSMKMKVLDSERFSETVRNILVIDISQFN